MAPDLRARAEEDDNVPAFEFRLQRGVRFRDAIASPGDHGRSRARSNREIGKRLTYCRRIIVDSTGLNLCVGQRSAAQVVRQFRQLVRRSSAYPSRRTCSAFMVMKSWGRL